MGGSGDCFFRAWIKAENAYHSKSQTEQEVTNAALQLRLEAIKYIRKHEQHYQELWRNDTMEKQCPRAGQPAPKNFEDFLKQASKKNYWVPHPSSCRPHWYPGSCMACLLRQGSQQPQKTLASGRLGSNLSKWGRQSNRQAHVGRGLTLIGCRQQLQQVLETPRHTTNTPRWGSSTPKSHTSTNPGDPLSQNRWGPSTPATARDTPSYIAAESTHRPSKHTKADAALTHRSPNRPGGDPAHQKQTPATDRQKTNGKAFTYEAVQAKAVMATAVPQDPNAKEFQNLKIENSQKRDLPRPPFNSFRLRSQMETTGRGIVHIAGSNSLANLAESLLEKELLI